MIVRENIFGSYDHHSFVVESVADFHGFKLVFVNVEASLEELEGEHGVVAQLLASVSAVVDSVVELLERGSESSHRVQVSVGSLYV